MEITMPRERLLEQLNRVAAAASGKPTMPILSSVRWQGDGGQIILTATDLEIELQARAEWEGEPGAFCVGAKRLKEILQALPAKQPLTFIAGDNGQLTLKCGRSRFLIATRSADDFPGFDQANGSEPKTFTVPSRIFGALIEPVMPAMAKGDVRYYLNGLKLEGEKGKLRAVASNGYVLAMHETELEKIPKFDIILPRNAVAELRAHLPDDESEAACSISSTYFRLEVPGLIFSSRLLEGQFPDWKKILLKNFFAEFVLDRGLLQSLIRRIAICSLEKFHTVSMEFNGTTARIWAQNGEGESAEEILDLPETIGEYATGYNADYLQSALSAFAGTNIRWRLDAGNHASMFTAEDSEALLWIVMPCRV